MYKYFILIQLSLSASVNAVFYSEHFNEADIAKKILQKSQQIEYAAVTPQGTLWKADELLTSAHCAKNRYDPAVDRVKFFNCKTGQEETIGIVGSLNHPLYIGDGGVDIARLKLERAVQVIEPIPLNNSVAAANFLTRCVELVSHGNFVINHAYRAKQKHWAEAIISDKIDPILGLEITYTRPGTSVPYSAVPVDGDSGSIMLKQIEELEADGTKKTKLRIVGIMSDRAILNSCIDYGQKASYLSVYEVSQISGFEDFFTKNI